MKCDFETGASNAASNNLVLSVMNDGAVYETRRHIGFATLQGANHRGLKFSDLAKNEAKNQRAMGCKFRPEHITEAAKIIGALTIGDCIETIRETWSGEPIEICGRLWFDKSAGNTYFSARISIPRDAGGFHIVDVPFQYGYGDFWQYACRKTLEKMGFEGFASGCMSNLPIKSNGTVWAKKSAAFRGIFLVYV